MLRGADARPARGGLKPIARGVKMAALLGLKIKTSSRAIVHISSWHVLLIESLMALSLSGM